MLILIVAQLGSHHLLAIGIAEHVNGSVWTLNSPIPSTVKEVIFFMRQSKAEMFATLGKRAVFLLFKE